MSTVQELTDEPLPGAGRGAARVDRGGDARRRLRARRGDHRSCSTRGPASRSRACGVLAVLLLAVPLLRGADWSGARRPAGEPRRGSRAAERLSARADAGRSPSTGPWRRLGLARGKRHGATTDLVAATAARQPSHAGRRAPAARAWTRGRGGLAGARARVRLPGARPRTGTGRRCSSLLLLFSFYAYVGAAHLRGTASLDAAFVAALLGVVLLGPLAGALVFAAPELTRLANDRRLTSMLGNLASFGWACLAAAWTLEALGYGSPARARLARAPTWPSRSPASS